MDTTNFTESLHTPETAQYKERLRIALKAAKICVYEVDIINQLYTFFENAEDIFGISGDKILSDVKPFSKLEPALYRTAVSEYFSHPDDYEVIADAFQSIFNGQPTTYHARMRAGGSDFIWCKLDVTPIMENGVPVKMIGVITDISDMKAKNDELAESAKHDSFTGLRNKDACIDLIRQSLVTNNTQTHALVLIDIDNFKHFNDTYGHITGDFIIKSVADMLKNRCRKTDIYGRFGGDEFILLIQNVTDIKWLITYLQQFSKCEANGYCCTNSIGISLFPQNADNFNELFEQADTALYYSKRTKGICTFFSDCTT